MTADSRRARQRSSFVRASCQADPAGLHKASEDAAARSYWRLEGLDAVLMDAPPADNDLARWLAMHKLLHDGGVRVPAILALDVAQGFVLLEDLGRATLLDTLDEDNADRWFDAAITQLLAIQRITPPRELPGYDDTLLGRELDLFTEWFLERELGITLSGDALQTWQDARGLLINRALAQPRVLVHRDFMPRNLMPVDGGLAVIDFQDAVAGPIAYDPLCLFKDAFVSWPEARIETWLRHYHERAVQAGLPVPEWPRLRRDVDLIGVHRHLKVIGIFARLKHRDGKSKYLADVPRFITYLDAVLPAHAQLAPLQALLQRQVWPAWHAEHGR